MKIFTEVIEIAGVFMMLAVVMPAAPTRGEPVATGKAMPASSVASVNGKALFEADLSREVQAVQAVYAKQVPPEQMSKYMPQIRQQAMKQMISRELLLQEASRQNIAVGDDEAKTAIARFTSSLPPNTTLDAGLKAAGISSDEFRRQIDNGIRIQKILDRETKDVTVSDGEASKYYEGHLDNFKSPELVSARHILVKVEVYDTNAQKAEKKRLIDSIRDRLIKGEDFAKVCAETSDDPGSRNKGGLYENFPRGQMDPPFEKAAFSQKVGEIGPVIETRFGYHVIKVENHSQALLLPFAAYSDRVKTYLGQQKKQEVVQKLIDSLMKKATITYAAGNSTQNSK